MVILLVLIQAHVEGLLNSLYCSKSPELDIEA